MPVIWASPDKGRDQLTDLGTDNPIILIVYSPPGHSERRHLVIENPKGDILMEIILTKATVPALIQALS